MITRRISPLPIYMAVLPVGVDPTLPLFQSETTTPCEKLGFLV